MPSLPSQCSLQVNLFALSSIAPKYSQMIYALLWLMMYEEQCNQTAILHVTSCWAMSTTDINCWLPERIVCRSNTCLAKKSHCLCFASLPGIYNLQTIFFVAPPSGPKRCNLRSSIYRELRNREMGRSDQARKARDNKRRYPLRM